MIHPIDLATGHELVQSIHGITSMVTSGFDINNVQG